MASFGKVEAFTAKASADLSGKLYHIVRFAGEGLVNQASHSAAAPDVGIAGVLQNKPEANQAATVGYFGESKVVAGGSLTAGKWITTNGSGRATAAASGDVVIGRALTTAANDGEVVRALLTQTWRLVGTN